MARKKCKLVTVCGRRRKICWNSKGKISSNTPAGKGRRGKKSRKGRRGKRK